MYLCITLYLRDCMSCGCLHQIIDFVPCDGKCVNGVGYDVIADLGSHRAMQLSKRFRNKVLGQARYVSGAEKPAWVKDSVWTKARSTPYHARTIDQFCFMATETHLKRYTAVFQVRSRGRRGQPGEKGAQRGSGRGGIVVWWCCPSRRVLAA